MFSKIMKRIREKLRPKEVYARIYDTETYRKLVPKGLSYENAQLKKENLLLKKSLKEKEEYLRYLIEKLEGKIQEEAYIQEKQIEKIKKSREFKILLKPEKPISVVSAYSFEPFRDADGTEYPYLAGFKICHDPDSALPYLKLLLKKSPKEKKVMALNTQPRIWFPYSIIKLFRDVRMLFHSLKHGGRLEVLITPDGLFTGDRVEVEVSDKRKNKRKQ